MEAPSPMTTDPPYDDLPTRVTPQGRSDFSLMAWKYITHLWDPRFWSVYLLTLSWWTCHHWKCRCWWCLECDPGGNKQYHRFWLAKCCLRDESFQGVKSFDHTGLWESGCWSKWEKESPGLWGKWRSVKTAHYFLFQHLNWSCEGDVTGNLLWESPTLREHCQWNRLISFRSSWLALCFRWTGSPKMPCELKACEASNVSTRDSALEC